MKRSQHGFTMIELIVVIVILGILSATALPKFIDMRSDAQDSAVKGIAGAATAAMSLNYSGCSLTNHVAAANKCVAVTACADVGGLMQGGVPTGYTVGGTDPGAALGSTSTCTITAPASGGLTPSANFTAIRAGN